MHVTLGQIRAFVTLAETASFRRAADVLHLSQPALTNRIHQLEDELGLRLFDRNTHSVELTSFGRAREIALVRRKGSTLHPSAEAFIEKLAALAQACDAPS